MAWTNPPTFADGDVLSAAQLNILSNNTEYLKGISDAPNAPFATVTAVGSTTTDFWLRHTHDHLHYKFVIENGTSDTIWIKVWNEAGTQEFGDKIFNDTDKVTTTQPDWEGSYDASALTDDAWYRIEVFQSFDGGSSNVMYLVYLEERTVAA